MTIGSIELTPEESNILKNIEFDQVLVFRNGIGNENGEFAYELMILLIKRGAIPEVRRRYFTDPDYNFGGRGRSRMDVFEKNGTNGNDIFRHGNFLRHMRYFLFGADLPNSVIESLSEMINSCGNVTSGDIEYLRKFARELTRKFHLMPHDAAEEFYKLSLDCGIGPHYAKSIHDAVKQVR